MDWTLPHRMTGCQWASNLEDVIADPDGWRLDDGVDFDNTPITREEYEQRLVRCTVITLGPSRH